MKKQGKSISRQNKSTTVVATRIIRLWCPSQNDLRQSAVLGRDFFLPCGRVTKWQQVTYPPRQHVRSRSERLTVNTAC